jgi:hypothetical protein
MKLISFYNPDSENIANLTQMLYYGKFEHWETSTLTHTNNTYSYEQFIIQEWREFCDLSNRTWCPRGLLKNYRLGEENKPSHMD